VCLECSDDTFSAVAAVHVRGDQLVSAAVPLVGDVAAVVGTGFVV
jgi:hypothetical protein